MKYLFLPVKLFTVIIFQPEIEKSDKNGQQLSMSQALKPLLSIPAFNIAVFVAIFSGILLAQVFVIWPQWVLYLGAPHKLIGINTIVGSIIESLGLFISGLFVKRFGEMPCFFAMFASYSVRFMAYSMLTESTVWFTVALELTEFFCFSFVMTALTRFAAGVAPPGCAATTQAIISSCYYGIGLGLGFLSSGGVFQALGGMVTFRIYSLLSAICFVVLGIIQLVRFVLNLRVKATISVTESQCSQ